MRSDLIRRNREITPAKLRRLAYLLDRQTIFGVLAPDQTVELDAIVTDVGAEAGTNAEMLAPTLASLAAGLLELVGRPLEPLRPQAPAARH